MGAGQRGALSLVTFFGHAKKVTSLPGLLPANLVFLCSVHRAGAAKSRIGQRVTLVTNVPGTAPQSTSLLPSIFPAHRRNHLQKRPTQLNPPWRAASPP